MKRFLFLFLCVITVAATAAAAVSVTATGVGPTKRDAEMAAQRAAVEQGIGTMVDSESLTQNFMLVEDKILSKARGYVKNYKVISEKQASDGNWEITIEAQVDEGDLKNDLNAIGILREKMGNPRILIIYDPTIRGSINDSSDEVVSEAFEGITEHLAELEFPVVDKRTADQFTLRKFSSSEEIYKESVGFGLANQAEYILVFNLKELPQSSTSAFHRARVMISGKIINTSSSQVYASISKKITGIDKDSREFALRKAGRKAGESAGKAISSKLIKRWESDSVSGRPVVLELLNIDDFSIIMEFKTKLKDAYGVKNINQRGSTRKSVEYELSYAGDISTLKDSIYKIFDSMSVRIAPPVTAGDRLTVDFAKNPEDAQAIEVPLEEEDGAADSDGPAPEEEEVIAD